MPRLLTPLVTSRRSWLLGAILAPLASGLCGCALFKTEDKKAEVSKLPKPKMSSDAVVMEINFLKAPLDDKALTGELWHEVDEQQWPPEFRRRLSASGFRCGLVGLHLPEALRKMLEEQSQKQAEGGVEAQARQTDNSSNTRRVQSRTGQRNEVLVSSLKDEVVVLSRGEDKNVRGQAFKQAQCVMAVKTYPLGDGRVRLEITPEVHHGQMKNRWVGQDGAFMMDNSKERQVFDDLRIDTVLAPGQALILSSDSPIIGLGGQMFQDSAANVQIRKMLLIRLAQTQRDDLFTEE